MYEMILKSFKYASELRGSGKGKGEITENTKTLVVRLIVVRRELATKLLPRELNFALGLFSWLHLYYPLAEIKQSIFLYMHNCKKIQHRSKLAVTALITANLLTQMSYKYHPKTCYEFLKFGYYNTVSYHVIKKIKEQLNFIIYIFYTFGGP